MLRQKCDDSGGGTSQNSSKVKIVNENVVETSLCCTCDYQPWACQVKMPPRNLNFNALQTKG